MSLPIKKFKKKPVVIEAVQFNSFEDYLTICSWVDSHGSESESNMAVDILEYTQPIMLIKTLEGTHAANIGDWIIRGVAGEYYPCKPDIFEATYKVE